MGDTYQTIVPLKVNKEEITSMQESISRYLIARKVIKDFLSDCTLGDQGFPPGTNYLEVVNGDEGTLLDLVTNGVEIVCGKRTIFFSNDIDEVNCPNCGINIIETDWARALDEWVNETGADKIECPNCSTSNCIIDYEFKPNWAFGDFGLTFWNWPPLREDFIKDIEIVIDKNVRIVCGKI